MCSAPASVRTIGHELLAQIDTACRDEQASLPTVLRLCTVLARKLDSRELRRWASKELYGYDHDDVELPDYRHLHADLTFDGVAEHGSVHRHRLAEEWIPDGVRPVAARPLSILQPVTELGDIAELAEDGLLSIHLRGAKNSAERINAHLVANGRSACRVDQLYWTVPVEQLDAIAGTIRTRLLGLVAELRQATSDGDGPPDGESIDNAVRTLVISTPEAPAEHPEFDFADEFEAADPTRRDLIASRLVDNSNSGILAALVLAAMIVAAGLLSSYF